jgi:chitinase
MKRPRRLIGYIFFFYLASHLLSGLSPCVAQDAKSFRVAGYLPDYRAASLNEDALQYLTDLILFSAEPTASGKIDMGRLQGIDWKRLQSSKEKHSFRLILCVGGWDRSSQFASVASTPVTRRAFVADALRLCDQYHFDGIDLDWEHPQDKAQQTDYAQLLMELAQAFRPRSLTVSITLAAWQDVPKSAFDAVDFVQIMSYDNAGQHSTFESAISDVQKVRRAGAPVDKIVLGLPFYGRNKNDSNETMTYAEIIKTFNPAKDINEENNLYFNGIDLIQKKTQYAIANGLAGVMVWEIGQDALSDQSLLRAIDASVRETKNPAGNP